MKKVLFLIVSGIATFAQASYLYWTVSSEDFTSAGIAIKDVSYVRVGYVEQNKHDEPLWSGNSLTAYDYYGNSMDTTDVSWDSSTGEDGFKVNVTGLDDANYGFYIELLNSKHVIIGRTGHEVLKKDKFVYDTYEGLGDYISTGSIGEIPSGVDVWHGTFEAVPEPSSMALLALGAGLVGLRRKLRKGKKAKKETCA